jgi:pimeloyl-ACP methyl ester carboxylesterase
MNERRFREAEERLWQSFGLAPTERRVHLPRIGANVRVQEIGEGPPVVFVHGGSNGGSSWAPLVAKLNFRCLLLDRPGCGLSEPTSHRHEDVGALATFADTLLVDLLDALHIDTAHVVATSFGG